MNKKYEQFCLESNRIEGEDRINPGDIRTVEYVLEEIDISNESDILYIHEIIGKYLKKHWVGKLRKVDVQVGLFLPPSYTEVPRLMNDFVKKLPKMDSWEAHNEFEKIHPFQDLNGRVGRLIWLSKAVVREGYKFNISFLQCFYYQTLQHYENGGVK